MAQNICEDPRWRARRYASTSDLDQAVREQALNEWNTDTDPVSPRRKWNAAIEASLRPLPNAPGMSMLRRDAKATSNLNAVERIAAQALDDIQRVAKQTMRDLGPHPVDAVGDGPNERRLRAVLELSKPVLFPESFARELIAVDFEATVGLKRVATSRDLALASILLGNRPSPGRSLRETTVAQVIAREQDLMRRAARRAQRFTGLGAFLRQGALTEALERRDQQSTIEPLQSNRT